MSNQQTEYEQKQPSVLAIPGLLYALAASYLWDMSIDDKVLSREIEGISKSRTQSEESIMASRIEERMRIKEQIRFALQRLVGRN